MARTRALITETERARIAGEEDVEEIKRYQAISRVRRRIEEELVEDMAILREHHEGLSELAQEVVCGPVSENRIATAGLSEQTRSEPDEGGPNAHSLDDAERERVREGLMGSGELLEQRVDAIETMYDYLRRNGKATKKSMVPLVDPEEVRYKDGDSVWSNMVKGKSTLSVLAGVESPPDGRSTWRYTE